MAEQLSEAEPLGSASEVVRHRGHVHVHVGAGTFGASDLEEARSIVDEEDTSSRDFQQLIEEGSLPTRLPRTMVGATAVLVALSLALAVVAGPLFAYTGHAAQDILDRDGYVTAVLPGGVR